MSLQMYLSNLNQLSFTEEEEKIITSSYEELSKDYAIESLPIEQSPISVSKDDSSFFPVAYTTLQNDEEKYFTYLFKNKYNSKPIHINCYEFWIGKKLDKDLSRVSMRAETFGDKITEAFLHSEIDFSDDKDFSNRFYLTASDEALAREFFTADNRKILCNFPDKNLRLDIFNDFLLVSAHQPINILLILNTMKLIKYL